MPQSIIPCHYFVISQMLFRKYGWSKLLFGDKSYRWLTMKRPFDDYSSRGSNVHAVKRFHSNMETVTTSPEGVQLAITTESEAGQASKLTNSIGTESSMFHGSLLGGRPICPTRAHSLPKHATLHKKLFVRIQLNFFKNFNFLSSKLKLLAKLFYYY